MHCMACGAEMFLMNVIQDVMEAPCNCERHVFKCSGCHVTNDRVILTRYGREDESEPLPMLAAPPTVPASTVQDEQITTPGLFGRLVARMRRLPAFRHGRDLFPSERLSPLTS
jgi:hypothetical protein